MTVYVDELATQPGGKQWCRLLGTDRAELDEFAALVLRQPTDYRQSGPPTHYNLTAAMRRLAIRKGAREITRAKVAELMQRRSSAA